MRIVWVLQIVATWANWLPRSCLSFDFASEQLWRTNESYQTKVEYLDQLVAELDLLQVRHEALKSTIHGKHMINVAVNAAQQEMVDWFLSSLEEVLQSATVTGGEAITPAVFNFINAQDEMISPFIPTLIADRIAIEENRMAWYSSAIAFTREYIMTDESEINSLKAVRARLHPPCVSLLKAIIRRLEAERPPKLDSLSRFQTELNRYLHFSFH